jgi:hypothetical protein
MMKRAVLVVAAVTVLAVAIALIAGQRAKSTYSSSCLVRFSLPLTSGTGTNYFDVNQTVALNELNRALHASVYGQAAKNVGTDVVGLAARTRIDPGPRAAFFTVTVTNTRSGQSGVESAAVCAALRDQLVRQRAAQRDAEAARLNDQLVDVGTRRDALGALPSPTTVEASELLALDAAYKQNLAQLAATLAAPADVVTSTPASAPASASTDDTARNLRIALAAVPLTCFLLLVLYQEISKRRPDVVPA